jgi:hypothetical protein
VVVVVSGKVVVLREVVVVVVSGKVVVLREVVVVMVVVMVVVVEVDVVDNVAPLCVNVVSELSIKKISIVSVTGKRNMIKRFYLKKK